MNKRIKIAFYLLFLSFNLYSQSKIIEATIKDNSNKKTISYVYLYLKNNRIGTISNEDGYVKLTIPNSIKNDTLIFSVLGYDNLEIPLNNKSIFNKDFFLTIKSYSLKEVTIIGKKIKKVKIIKIGKYKNKVEGKSYNKEGNQVALFFPNKNKDKGIIKSVSYYIKNEGQPTTKFRVRIYDVNNTQLQPNNEVLTENIIVSAKNGDEWLTIDMEKYGISIPENGFFVAMEWLPESKNYSFELSYQNTNNKSTYNGQVLGLILESKNTECITWNKAFFKNWQKYVTPLGSINVLNAAIYAEVKIYK